jgi:DNA repair and recombination protein RAD54 and RAD54-like protein
VQTVLCRDVRLIKIKRNHQTDRCLCTFAVMFYKQQCLGSKEKVIIDRRTELVTIDDIHILQKLQSEKIQDGSMKWNSAEDCPRLNKCKLVNTRFAEEIAYLIVLSSLRGMEFSIKMVEGNIIYQIIKGDQARYNIDSMNIPPGFGKNMEIVSFQPRDETLRPSIRIVPIIFLKANNLSEGRRITVKSELDSAQYVENLYEQVDLRRSKRLKTQPDRFTSYDMPNFNRSNKRKEEHASPAKNENSQCFMSSDSPVQGESSDEDVLAKATLVQTVTGSFTVKEHPRPAEGQQKNLAKRTRSSCPMNEKTTSVVVKKSTTERNVPDSHIPHTHVKNKEGHNLPMKEKPTSIELKKTTIERNVPDSHIPHTPVKNKESHNHLTLSFRPKSLASSHSLDGNTEPAFCQKRGRKRKKHMCNREYRQMIDQCIGNIQWEMEGDPGFKLDVQMMNCSGHAYEEEDFTWPSSTHSQEKKDEHEELWKEMDYSLATLAFLDPVQVHDFVL